jgi:pyrrolysine biosynthesis protein PylC
MVGLLGGLYAEAKNDSSTVGASVNGVVYEHIHVSGRDLKISGERIMTEGGSLDWLEDFFGADEAITNFEPGRDPWVATLIFCGATRQEACEKRNLSIAEIVRRLDLGDGPAEIW